VRRAVSEELGLERAQIGRHSVTFLAMTFEADICNFALMAIVRLSQSSDQLNALINTSVREDHEFSAIDFMIPEEIPRELLKASREYHPSTSIRMIYAYIYLRGQAKLRERLDSLSQDGSEKTR